MTSKAILWNGTKLCGKDSAISYLLKQGMPLVRRECKDHLHKLTQLFFCVPEDRYWEIYNDRSLKELPLLDFHVYLKPFEGESLQKILGYSLVENWDEVSPRNVGKITGSIYEVNLSIREAMIYVSEILCKSRFDENYFGVARARSIKDGEVIVDGSCGFKEELPPLIDRVGMENILLLRIHREGCTFEGDSRNFIEDGIIANTVDIYNNGTEQEYLDEVYNVVVKWLST